MSLDPLPLLGILPIYELLFFGGSKYDLHSPMTCSTLVYVPNLKHIRVHHK
jgi:hypothetical protein